MEMHNLANSFVRYCTKVWGQKDFFGKKCIQQGDIIIYFYLFSTEKCYKIFQIQTNAVLLNFLFINESWTNMYHDFHKNIKLHNCF